MIQRLLTSTTAAENKFITIPMENRPFSITCDFGDVVGGTPTYSLLVCNFTGAGSDFIAISDATNLSLTTAIKSDSFEFAYLALKYTANSATGTVQFYLNTIK